MSSTNDTSAPQGSSTPAPSARNSLKGCLIAVVLVLLAGYALLGGVYAVEAPIAFLLGWGFYLYRVLPGLSISWDGIASFLLMLLFLTIGVHVAAQWWLQRGRPDDESPAWTPAQTARLVGLVCLSFAAAIGIIGVVHQAGWLLNSREPIVESNFFEAVHRSQSKDHMHEMGVGFQGEVERTNSFTNGVMAADGRVLHSWQTAILPFIESATVDEMIDFGAPWHDPINRSAIQTIVPEYLNPGIRHHEQTSEGLGASHYAANMRLIRIDYELGSDDVTDGLSETILAGEVNVNFRAWGDPLNLRDPELGINKSDDGFGGPFTGGSHFLFTDGAVRFVNENVDPAMLRSLSTPNAGDEVESF